MKPSLLPFAIALTVAGCGTAEAPRPRPALTVAVEPAALADFTPRLSVLGTVTPLQSVEVRTRVDGQIVAVLFTEGDTVRAGQPLFRLDDRAIRAEIAQSRAALASAAATSAQAAADLKRSQALVANGFVSTATIDTRRAAADVGAAGIGSARAAIAAAETALSYLTVRAPVAGRTGEINFKQGATVRTGDTLPLVTVNQLSPILVRFAVPPAQIQPLRAAMRTGLVAVMARTDDGGAAVATGRLVFLDNSVDARTGSLAAKAEFGNRGDVLWPGALVDLEVPLGRSGRWIALPEAAVQNGPDFTYVWTIGANDTAALTKVTLAGRAEGRVFIAGGLVPGQRVVTDALAKIKVGDKVRIKGAAPEPRTARA